MPRTDQDQVGRIAGAPRLAGMSGPLLTAGEVAELLGVPKSWVYEQSRKGTIPTVTLGHYRRYRAEAIAAWIEEREDEPHSAALLARASS
jgi:excisionase family DNA binding protein